LKNDESFHNLGRKERTRGLDMDGRIEGRKPVIGFKNKAYAPFLKPIGEEIIYCGYCGREIAKPRREKGEIVQRYCNRICKDRFRNLNRYVLIKQFMDFLSKSGFLAIPSKEGERKKS
jgi:hypothetical protein